jgi:hypothetical protein
MTRENENINDPGTTSKGTAVPPSLNTVDSLGEADSMPAHEGYHDKGALSEK